MHLVEFVRQRAVEDSVLARAVDPPEATLMHSSRLALRLVDNCRGRIQWLTPRQHELMLTLADRHCAHGDYDPQWWDEFPPRSHGRSTRHE